MMDERELGTRDVTFDLVSIIYHALQGAETYSMYVADADQAGDDELVSFFRECIEDSRKRADRAKGLLRSRLGRGEMR